MTTRTVGQSAVPLTRASWLGRLYGSVIGKKLVMALTGIVLVGFIVVHMGGNLLAFRGAEALNDYAHLLKSTAPLLWGTRIVVFLSLVLHVHAAVALTALARGARPARYDQLEPQVATWSARSMRVGGFLLAVFIIFHILHFTTGTIFPTEFSADDAYGNVIRGFSRTWVAAFYIVSMLALALHLRHGVWSLFQTLGANHPHVNAGRRWLAWSLAVLVPVGFVAVPLGVVFGWLR